MGVFSAGLCWKSLNFRNSKTSSKIHCHDTKMIPVVVGEFEGSMIYHFRMNDVARPWVCSQELLQNEKVDIINDAWPSKLATDFHMMIHDMDDESMTDLSVHIYIYIDGSTVVGSWENTSIPYITVLSYQLNWWQLRTLWVQKPQTIVSKNPPVKKQPRKPTWMISFSKGWENQVKQTSV